MLLTPGTRIGPDEADRIVRLKREAQLLASLHHPSIAHGYGLEHLEFPVQIPYVRTDRVHADAEIVGGLLHSVAEAVSVAIRRPARWRRAAWRRPRG